MTTDIQTGGQKRSGFVSQTRAKHPEIQAKIEELLAQSLRYNRELLRIHQEITALRAKAAELEANESKGVSEQAQAD